VTPVTWRRAFVAGAVMVAVVAVVSAGLVAVSMLALLPLWVALRFHGWTPGRRRRHGASHTLLETLGAAAAAWVGGRVAVGRGRRLPAADRAELDAYRARDVEEWERVKADRADGRARDRELRGSTQRGEIPW
jgi:hypothetical protein